MLAPSIRVLEARDERSYGSQRDRIEALYKFPVVISRRLHPIPSRTRKLSSLEPMVLLGRPSGRVGHCRDFLTEEPRLRAGRIPRTEPRRSFVWAFCVLSPLVRESPQRPRSSCSLGLVKPVQSPRGRIALGGLGA
ncbi:MAG: hypothetical protein QOH18_2625, partial [Solirubrobacterales bacterium]|nr:hypothetical protein [Solirubrobacterales bacterium]